MARKTITQSGSQQPLDLEFNQPLPDSGAQLLPDDFLVFEVIKRLPVKNVMQCKCVSKSWYSIIRLPKFAEAFRNCNPCCIVFSIGDHELQTLAFPPQRFHYSPLQACEQPQKFFDLYNDDFLFELDINETGRNTVPTGTRVINGLFCHYNDHQVSICNVFTGEVMDAPEPPELPPSTSCLSYSYFFGYDPVNRLYKLLCNRYILINNHHGPNLLTHLYNILTLGNNSSWKELVPDGIICASQSQNICINGILYWMGFHLEGDMVHMRYYLCFLNLTSDGEEKIGYCSIPSDISIGNGPGPHCDLLHYRGRLSLLSRKGANLTLYTLEDCVGNRGDWTSHEFILPGEFGDNKVVWWVDNLPTGDILLGINESCQTLLYSCGYKNGKFEKRLVAKLPIGFKEMGGSVFCGLPNIATLDTLINRGFWYS